jgi:hypothetical protein
MPNISRARWKADKVAGFVLTNPDFKLAWMRAIGRALVGKKRLTLFPYFCNYRNMKKPDPLLVTRSADRFAALGAEPRLAILRLLLSAHPTGMIAGEVQEDQFGCELKYL